MIALLPLIAVLNLSHVPDATVAKWTAAVQRQVVEDVAPVWHVNTPVQFFPHGQAPPAGAWQVRVVPGSQRSSEGGYHLVTPQGVPYANVFVIKGEPTELTLSHEVIEMEVDWGDERFERDFPYMWLVEVSDPVETLSYLKDGVAVSDFVFPSWYNALSLATQFDFLGQVTGPGQVYPGGYAVQYDLRDGSYWRLAASTFGTSRTGASRE